MKYRWEFMRRDEEYQADYKTFIRDDTSVEDKGRLVSKYFSHNALHMIDPNLSFEETSDWDQENVVFPPFFTPGSIVFSPCAGKPEEFVNLQIKINFEHVNSIAQLKKHISDEIDVRYQDLLAKGLIRRQIKEQKGGKKNVAEYDLIVKIGDMKKKECKTDKDIARVIYPKVFKDNPRNAERKVNRWLNRYKELIEGGWREITYP